MTRSQNTPAKQSIAGHAKILVAEQVKAFCAGAAQPVMLQRICRFVLMCFGGLVPIRDVHSADIPLTPNASQTIMFAAMMVQAANEQPIRIRILKSRKTGISTGVQAFFADVCAGADNQIAKTLAHESDATHEIFEIAKRAARGALGVDASARMIRWPNGSWYGSYTAGGQAVGAGGTPSLLHRSEIAKWKLNKVETEYNSAISVPDVAETCIVDESTAVGRELFFQRFEESHVEGHPWCPIFIPWYVDERCRIDGRTLDERNDYEIGLCNSAKTYGYDLNDEQLAWRRFKILDLGDEAIFRQEYPSTPQEAVQATSGLIFPFARNCIVDVLAFDAASVPADERVGGVDFGFYHPTAIWSGVCRDNVLWLTHFYRESERLAVDHVDGLTPWTTYWCDPAEVQARAELVKASHARGMNCRFLSAPRRRHVGEDISSAEMRTLVRWAKDGRLKILSSIADQFLAECDNLTWDEKTGKPDDRRGPPSVAHYDTIFALKYLTMGLDASSGDPVKYEPSKRMNLRRELAAI